VGLEGLLTEFLVAAVLDSVHLKSVRVSIDEMVLGEEVRDGHEGGADAEGHHEDDLCVWDLGATEVGDVLSDVVGHLGGGGGGAVVVLNHTVMELWGHGDNHVIVVGVEVATLWDIETKWWGVVVSSQQVVRVVGQTRLHETCLGQLWGPHTLVGVLSLMHSHVGWPDSVVNSALSEVPLLEIVRAVLLMTWVYLGQVYHLGGKFSLTETFVDQKIVLLMHSTVATLARSGEDLESTSQCC
jgi:hypothetical protein